MKAPAVEKPPYRIPSMKEIRDVPWNGLSAISTFSGCGGSSLGYRWAGFKVLWASEFIPAAADTYRANFPTTPVDVRDVRDVKPEEILAAIGKKQGELDLFDGSPPCASFSLSGSREGGWGKVKKYCVDPGTRILKKDLTWVRAGDLKVGDKLVGFEEHNVAGNRGRRFQTTAVESVAAVREPSLNVVMEDGTKVLCSTLHRWLVVSGSNLRWKRADQLKVGDELLSLGKPWEVESSREAGWLAGIFDGEGCVSRSRKGAGRTRLLSIGQKEGMTLTAIRRGIETFGFDAGDSRSQTPTGEVFNLNILGGLPERLRFLGRIRPERLVAKAEKLWEDVNVGAAKKVKVLALIPFGERPLIALSTTHKTFIAEGLLSHNSDSAQRTDDLFFEFARLVDGVRPRVFVAENVKGLVIGSAKGYFKEILAKLKSLGYRVACRVLDAQWLGVPQRRARTIFIGVREDLSTDPAHPLPFPFRYTLRDACPWITKAVHDTSGNRSCGEFTNEPVPTITVGINSVNALHYQVRARDLVLLRKELEQASFKGYAIEAEWRKLLPGAQSDKYINLVRAHPDQPCPTVTQTAGQRGAAGVAHPHEPRKFTIGELRRVCGFPDDFELTGTYQQQWERCGRAVPPPMSRAVGIAVAKTLLEHDAKKDAKPRRRAAAKKT